jgi:hypothetical protein
MTSIHLDTLSLHVEPNDTLREALADFYRELTTEQIQAIELQTPPLATVRNINGLIRPHPYKVEDQSIPTLVSRMGTYATQTLKGIAEEKIGLLAEPSQIAHIRQTAKYGGVPRLALIPSDEVMGKLRSFKELHFKGVFGDFMDKSIEVSNDTPSEARIADKENYQKAIANLINLLQAGSRRGSPVVYVHHPRLVRTPLQ